MTMESVSNKIIVVTARTIVAITPMNETAVSYIFIVFFYCVKPKGCSVV